MGVFHTKEKCPCKLKIAFCRVFGFCLKMLLLFLEAGLIVAGVFGLLLLVFVCIEKGEFINPFSEFEVITCWYNNISKSTDIPTIFEIAVSLLFSIVALYQTHYTRIQDRAEALPGKQLESIRVGTDVVKNIREILDYTIPERASTLLEFQYGEHLSSYYKAYPYRLFVYLQRDNNDEWEEIKILRSWETNSKGQSSGKYRLFIEGSESRLLTEYCDRVSQDQNYRLEMILDVKWENSLVPIWSRNFASAYIREKIRLNNTVQSHGYGIEYHELKSYFKTIIDKGYDSMVFISRRCYILFQLFALMEGWNNMAVQTDLGLFATRNKLKKCKHVIVIDDIGFTGMSMEKVLHRVEQYVSKRCKVDGVLYAANLKGVEQISKIKLGCLKTVKVKSYLQLTDRQCQELSCKLVSVILASGMPYSTFVYPIWGEKKAELDLDEIRLSTKNAILNDYKWKSSYVKVKNFPATGKVGDFECIRVYRKQDDSMLYFLPFLFMKSMNYQSAMDLFQCMADTFRIFDKHDIADEIYYALKAKENWKKDAMEYLACLMTCICSKAFAEVLEIKRYVNNHSEIARCSLQGSFPEFYLDFLDEFDKEFSLKFFKEWSERIKDIDIIGDPPNNGYVYYKELSEFISQNATDCAYNMLSDIFQWMKEQSLKNDAKSEKIRSISVDNLMELLRNSEKYSEDELYMAQIECWDRGIATYRFEFDEMNGLVAKCGIGEMSAVIPALKYQKLIKAFYKQEFLYEGIVNSKVRSNILEEIISNALKNGEYTEADIEKFRKIYEERNGSLYGMLV